MTSSNMLEENGVEPPPSLLGRDGSLLPFPADDAPSSSVGTDSPVNANADQDAKDRDESDESTGDSLATGVAYLAVLSVVQRIVGFARSLIFCRLLTDEQLGRWSLSFSFLLMCAPMAVFGLPGTFGRYFEYFRQRKQTSLFLRQVLSVAGIAAVGFLTLLMTFPDTFGWFLFGSENASELTVAICVTLALVIAINVLSELATAMREVRLVSVAQFIHSIVFTVTACLLVCCTNLHHQGIVAGYGIGAAAGLLTLLVGMWPRLRGALTPLSPQPLATGLPSSTTLPSSATLPGSWSMWQKLLPFAAWLWVSDILFNMFDAVDRIMIVHFTPVPEMADSLVGQYHSSRVIPLVLVAVAAVMTGTFLPYISEYWEQGKKQQATAITRTAMKATALVFLFAGGAVLAASPLLFGWLLGGRYDGGLSVLPLTLTYSAWFGLIMLAQNHLLCCERAGLTIVSLGGGLVLNLALNSILLPMWGLPGAVAATAAANLFALALTLYTCSQLDFQVDRSLCLAVMLPAVLILPTWLALAAIVAIGLITLYTTAIFSASEKQLMWERIQQRLSPG